MRAASVLLVLALVGGMAGASSAQDLAESSALVVCDESKTVGSYTLTFTGVDYDPGAGTSTFSYRLDFPPTVGPPPFLLIAVCGDIGANGLVSTTPPGGALVLESGIYGVKWTGLPGSSPIAFSVTVMGAFGIGTVPFSVGTVPGAGPPQICGMTCERVCAIDLDCPPDVTVDCSESTNPSNTGTATAAGFCPPVTVTHTDAVRQGACAKSFTIVRTWRATDQAGNVATCAQLITVEDTTPPAFQGCPDTVLVTCPNDVPPVTLQPFTVTDDCSQFTIEHVGDVILSEGCPLVIERTYRATDACGNYSECSYVIVARDDIPPTITCPGPLTVDCSQGVPQPAPTAVQFDDNCDGAFVEHAGDFPDDVSCPQVIRRIYRVTDWCGNEAECEQLITIVDNTPPDLVCPQNLTLECGSSTDPSVTGAASARDACGDATVSYSDSVIPSQLCPQNSAIVRTWTATDECGNQSTCDQIITVADRTPPALECPGNVTVECGDPTDPSATGTAEARDGCGSATVSYNDVVAPGGPNCPQGSVITRTWTATDECGNAASCDQIITVVDTTPPALECPGDVTVECDGSTDPSATGTAFATDACGAATITFSDNVAPGGPDCPQGSVITRTWRAVDGCGNAATCNQVITLVDTTAPTIVCPDTMWVACGEAVPEPDPGSVEASDNCGSVTVTHEGDSGDNGPEASLAITEIIYRTYRATDECGNYAECVQVIVTGVDDEPPVIHCPHNFTFECDSDETEFNTPEVTDNCDPQPILEYTDVIEQGTRCPQDWRIHRTWTATDASGNTATLEQTIDFIDTTPPVFTGPDTLYVDCADPAPKPYEDGIEATDNCGRVTLTWLGDFNPNGILAMATRDESNKGSVGCAEYGGRRYKATDECGNEAEHTFIFVRLDTTPPSIQCPPSGKVACRGDIPQPDPSAVSVQDDCNKVAVVFVGDVSDGRTCPETITRTYRAVDKCGNEAECEQVFVVDDDIPPTIECPDSLYVECNQQIPAPDTSLVVAEDNCGSVMIEHVSDVPLRPNAKVRLVSAESDLGVLRNIILRTYRATDECGNASECVQVIEILPDFMPPVITCADDKTVECDDQWEFDVPSVTDDCDPSPGLDWEACEQGPAPSTVDPGCPYPQTICRKWIATDASGNSAFCEQTVTVVDTTGPFIACPGSLYVGCGQQIPPPDTSLVEAQDNCTGVTVTHVGDSVGPNGAPEVLAGQDVIIRTYRATDACGNYSECEQVIVLDIDRTPPTIICPGDTTIECSDAGNLVAVPPEVRDDCDPRPAVELVADSLAQGQCPQEWARYFRWRATDASGNSAECVQVVWVQDTTPPEIFCPDNVTVECDDLDKLPPATARDNCDPEPLVTFVDRFVDSDAAECPPPTCYIDIERTWTATDDCGNSSSCVQYIRAADSKAPVIACDPRDIDAEGYEVDIAGDGVVITVECDMVDKIPPPEVRDNCDPNPILTYQDYTTSDESQNGGQPDPNCGCPYNYGIIRKWTAEDHCGNTSVCWWTIRVMDRTGPILTCAPDTSISCDSEVVFTDPVAVDNCDPDPEIVVKDDWTEEGPGYGEVTHVRCWIAEDRCDNKSPECCQRITVRSCSEPCTFTMWEWGACCPEDEGQNPRSTMPACVRDHYFSQVFPNGVLVGDPGGIGGGEPDAYAALWTSSAAIMDYLPAFGAPGALTGDLVDPLSTPSGLLCGQILALRLNREYTCSGVFAELCFTEGVACLGEYVIPASCGMFADMTVDEFLAIADQVVAGNLEVLDPYGASPLDVKVTAQCLNYELSGCVPDCGDRSAMLALDAEVVGASDPAQSGQGAVPVNFVVYQSYPNPFGTRTNIRFGMPTDGWVTVHVFNAMGRKIATVLDEHRSAGFHGVVWDGRDDRGYMVPSGVYFYRVQHGKDSDVKKMILSR